MKTDDDWLTYFVLNTLASFSDFDQSVALRSQMRQYDHRGRAEVTWDLPHYHWWKGEWMNKTSRLTADTCVSGVGMIYVVHGGYNKNYLSTVWFTFSFCW